jgi:hypothetical protein
VTPIPSFPQVREGELRVYMRQGTIDTKGQVRLASLRELQSATGEELRPLFGRPLLPSVLDKAFKGEL